VYLPEHFRESRIERLQAFLQRHPLATLVATTRDGLSAEHLPLLAHLDRQGSGWLRGHVARTNPVWQELSPGAEVLAVFTGAQTYVSPNWYPSKRQHGRVVPTWNYAAVHVHGRIRFIEEASWLRSLVEDLTRTQEQGGEPPWQVSDAPPDYIEAMLGAIVGLEIEVGRVEGKFKGGQNRSVADREGVRAALREQGLSPDQLAELVPLMSRS
jgi:transcriptional regulator